MDQKDFLKRFNSNSRTPSPAFDAGALGRWAAEFRSGLPASGTALAARFQAALEMAGGKFYSAADSEDAARLVCDIVQERGVRSVIAWNHPLLGMAGAALQLAGINVSLSERAAGRERDSVRQATIASDVGLTSCDYAIAETGTLLMLANEKQGRLTSLVPITHIAIISPTQLVPALADALKLLRLARLGSGDQRLPSNISLHTGPSKTADIEQTLTKGVHGPKEVHVILDNSH
jgi:L-lactate dehydrogenase complex protein LldG